MPKEKTVVVGGIVFKGSIQERCHLQHPALRQAKASGEGGWSPFTMDDVLVEQSAAAGVFAVGTGVVGRCTNVKMRQCAAVEWLQFMVDPSH